MKSYNTLVRENREWLEETFRKIDGKMQKLTLRSRNKLPDGVDENGVHIDQYEKNPNGWTNGFWGALNVVMYEYTGNEEYLETAKMSEKLLDKGLKNYDLLNHDVGFIWHILCGSLYRLTGSAESRTRNLFAAATLSSRYVLNGGFIRAWNPWTPEETINNNWSIIDCMMNLPILYWASRELKDDRFKQIAMAHADMVIDRHVRDDGSIRHIVEHDREAGVAVRDYGGQGCAEGSSWSRGQAWGLYGFVLSYIHTGEERYLNIAKLIANYFISAVSDDWIPRIDFRAPQEPEYFDTTAGVCAACGLIEMAKRLPEDEGGMYAHAAIKMLRAMTERFACFDPNVDYILGHGSVRYPVPGTYTEKTAGVHKSIIYADMFYAEAITKLLGTEFSPW